LERRLHISPPTMPYGRRRHESDSIAVTRPSSDTILASSRERQIPMVRGVEWADDTASAVPLHLEAVILAGGKGTRLAEVVSDRPKPMAEVAGRPFLDWLLLSLRQQGVRRLVLSTGHLADRLERHCGDGSQWDLEIVYSREEEPLGTAGAIRQALRYLAGDRFFVLNGDSFCPASLFSLFAQHARRDARATMWLAEMADCARYGQVELDGSAVTAFREKEAGAGPGLVNAGVYLFERDIFEPLPAGRPISLEREVLPELVRKGLYGVRGAEPVLDIGTPESYREAQTILPALTGQQTAPRSLAFVDRDGTIIVHHHHLTDPDQVELLPGAAGALRRLRALGLGIVVVTNQSVVGRGLIDEAGLGRVHARMLALLEAEGVHVDDIYHCPHRPEDGCRCRKPGTALVDLAVKDWHGDRGRSFVIGDNRSDVELGQRVGATTILVRTGHGAEAAAAGGAAPDHVVDDLSAAVPVIEGALARWRTRDLLDESARTLARTAEESAAAVVRAADVIAAAFRDGKKLLLCGNGGSAADCQHMAAEFVSRLRRDFDRRALPAVALTTDSSFLTAYANDIGFDGIFERQVEALGQPGDVLLGISTSGGSRNVVRAAQRARAQGLSVIALIGRGGALAELADVTISVPSSDTQHIQEAHLAVEHAVCDLVERQLFPGANR
jgi:phosphoheptose isomerase